MNVSELRTSLLMDHKNAYQDLTAAQETLRQAQQTAEDLYLEAP